MKIKVEFFKNQFINAIDAGVYEVVLSNEKEQVSLYIGESVHVLVRAAIHIYRLKKNASYFGFTTETINDENIILTFKLLENVEEKSSRKEIELEYIKSKRPITQNSSNDNQLSKKKRINAVNDFLSKEKFTNSELY